MSESSKILTVNPATGARLETYRTVGADRCMKIAQESAKAFRSWKETDVGTRGEVLKALARCLRDDRDELALEMTLEMGKPIRQSRAEVEKCAWTAETVAREGTGWLAEEEASTDAKKSLVCFEPLGPILGVEPWNFPAWQALRFAIPTLMAGNTVLVRPSSIVPGSSLLLEQEVQRAGFPGATFRVLLMTHATVEAVISSKDVVGVSFTGSNKAGAKVAAAAGSNTKKCVMELGGSDPFVVLEDADVEAAAEAGAESRLINSGQSCINAKRFLVVEAVYGEFKERFVNRMLSRVVGDPLDPKTDVGPLVREAQLKEVNSQVEDAVRKGARLVCGGERAAGGGFYYEPTVLEDCDPRMRVMGEEVFGPVAPLMRVKGEEEAISIANLTRYGLGASIWTRNEERAEGVAARVEAGVVFINGIVKSDPGMPFGGVKASGFGREISKYGIREFTNVKGLNYY